MSTLAQLLTKWSAQLNSVSPRYWTNAELVNYANDASDELTEELFLIEDTGAETLSKSITFTASTKKISRATGSFVSDGYKVGMPIFTSSTLNPGTFTLTVVTALEMTVAETLVNETVTASIYDGICHLNILTDGTVEYAVDDRIVRIRRAKLMAEDSPLQILRDDCIATMDATYTDWEDADESTPHTLLTEGIGTNKVRIYPPSDTADILKMIVYRNQLVALDSTNTSVTPELAGKYHKYFDNGVYKRAYSKDDQETYKPDLMEKYRALFEKDKNDIRKAMNKRNYSDTTCVPPLGCL